MLPSGWQATSSRERSVSWIRFPAILLEKSCGENCALACRDLDFYLGGDWKAPACAKCLLRNLDGRRSLLSFVFIALHRPGDFAHQIQIVTAFRRDLLHALVVFDIVLEDGIECLVRRQRVAIFLIGPQLRRGGLIQS